MPPPNLKLTVAFEFDLEAPPAFTDASHEKLCRAVQDLLGTMVLQGMPTITAKQLAKAGITLLSHHHHLDVLNTAAAPVPREALIAAGPHLTNDELEQFSRRTAGRIPLAPAERDRFLRRHALALVGDFRLVPCVLQARLLSGKDATLQGRLNLTNGSVLVSEPDRQSRLQTKDAPIRIDVDGAPTPLRASCAGHTLSGPVIEVPLAEIAAHRDTLIALWLKGNPGAH